jgi:hypothetical protein
MPDLSGAPDEHAWRWGGETGSGGNGSRGSAGGDGILEGGGFQCILLHGRLPSVQQPDMVFKVDLDGALFNGAKAMAVAYWGRLKWRCVTLMGRPPCKL